MDDYKFLEELNPSAVLLEVDDGGQTLSDMEAAKRFCYEKRIRVGYIGYSETDILSAAKRHPFAAAYHDSLTACMQQLPSIKSKEELRDISHFVADHTLRNSGQKRMPEVWAKRLEEGVKYMWNTRENIHDDDRPETSKDIIAESIKSLDALPKFLRPYFREFLGVTNGVIGGKLERTLDYFRSVAIYPVGAVVGSWHFQYIKDRMEAYSRKTAAAKLQGI